MAVTSFNSLFPANPQYGAARRQIDSSFADKGLINSSAYAGKQAEAADLDQQTRYNQQNAMIDRAISIWEKLAAQNIAKKQLAPKSKWRAPADPGFFKQLNGASYSPYSSPYGDPPENEEAPIGDPTEQWQRVSENVGPTMGQMQLSQQAAATRAAQDLNERQFAWQQSQARENATNAQTADTNATWENMTQNGLTNYVAATDNDPSTAALFPQQLLNAWKSQYGIDVVEEAKKGNERALGILRTIYPGGTWKALIADAAPALAPARPFWSSIANGSAFGTPASVSSAPIFGRPTPSTYNPNPFG